MKYQLPENHALSNSIIANLVFKEKGGPALTDVQYESLEAGVGHGKSVLVVSPTSTGKTQIALWAIAHGLETGCNTVYLVTHRALAKQKFEDFKTQLLKDFLGGDGAALVIATGDYVEDAEGGIPAAFLPIASRSASAALCFFGTPPSPFSPARRASIRTARWSARC